MKTIPFFAAMIIPLLVGSDSSLPLNAKSRLTEWRKGVWILPDGSYTIYTDTHYFVLVASGDAENPNIYCGASQIRYDEKGMARKQVIRVRQAPGEQITFSKQNVFEMNHTEAPLVIDPSLFAPGVCNIEDGVIYDSITEVTEEYILLSTCNGDKEKIYSNGVSVYLPAGGGEAYAYRIERFK